MKSSGGIRWFAAAFLLVLHVAAAQSNPVRLDTEIFIVTRDGRFVPALEAIPGEVVEYRITATNVGNTTLPAGRVTIIGPVMSGFAYVPDTATPSSTDVLTEVSVDGVTFSREQLVTSRGPISPWDYRAIRWTLLQPLEPGAVATFTYGVVVLPDDPVVALAFLEAAKETGEVPDIADFAPVARRNSSVSPDFQILSYTTRWEGDYLWVIGEVRNTGSVPAGVELQVLARDASGRVVDVATFWPAGIQNIRPGASYGFRHPVTRERSAVRFEVQVVGTEVW